MSNPQAFNGSTAGYSSVASYERKVGPLYTLYRTGLDFVEAGYGLGPLYYSITSDEVGTRYLLSLTWRRRAYCVAWDFDTVELDD
jgi:hypothetical protein